MSFVSSILIFKKGSFSISDRNLMPSCLPGSRSSFFHLLFSLLVVGSTLFPSCNKPAVKPDGTDMPPVITEIEDSVSYIICVKAEKLSKLDFYIYETEGLGSLVKHYEYTGLEDWGWDEENCKKGEDGSYEMEILCPKGDFRIVAIANYFSPLGIASLQRYDAIRQLKADFRKDNPACPFMSGELALDSGELNLNSDKNGFELNSVKMELELSPLMSVVELTSISNSMDDYELVENPRIRLNNINSSALLLEKSDFSPTESIEYGQWQSLENDIGFYTQYPHILLYCYPNSYENSPVRTELELECRINGKACSFLVEIPSIQRNSLIAVDLVVDSQWQCDSFVSYP